MTEISVMTNADKAREAANLGQELKKRGFTHTQASQAASHELKHALADKGKEGKFSLVQRDGLTVPTYSSIGSRSDQEKVKIALAPGVNSSDTDLQIAHQALENITNASNKT